MDIHTPSSSQTMSDTFLFSAALIFSGMVNLYMLPSFILRGNVPGICTLLWLFLSNMLLGIDSVIPSNVLLQAPIYCDIATKIFLGMQIAVPAGMLCFAMDLHYYIVDCESSYHYERRKLVRKITQLFVCVVIPLLYMAIHTIVQDHRFDLVNEFGCLPSAQTTLPAFLVIWIPLGFFAMAIPAYLKWHEHRLSYQYWLNEDRSNWRYVEMELVMTYPVHSLNEQRRLVKAEYFTAAWIALLFASALIIYTVEGFVPYGKPQFSRIDVFDTLGNFPGYLGPIHAMLWSGPVYTYFLFKHNEMLQLFRPYALFVEWVYRLSDRASFKRFEEHWRSIFVEKGLLEKPPRTWRFHQKEDAQRFTEMPKRVERKSRLARAKAKAHELADRLGPKKPDEVRKRPNPWRTDCYLDVDDWMLDSGPCLSEEGRPHPTVLKYKPPMLEMPMPPSRPSSPAPRRPKRVKRPAPSYQGWVGPKPPSERSDRQNGPERKPTRREEVKRAKKVVKAYRRDNPSEPLFTIPESPLTEIQNTDEHVYGPVIPLTKEELAEVQVQLARERAEKQAEEEELAAIRAEMRANRF